MSKFTYTEEGDDWSDSLNAKNFDPDGLSLSNYNKQMKNEIEKHNKIASERVITDSKNRLIREIDESKNSFRRKEDDKLNDKQRLNPDFINSINEQINNKYEELEETIRNDDVFNTKNYENKEQKYINQNEDLENDLETQIQNRIRDLKNEMNNK
jgi:hypothetical protein